MAPFFKPDPKRDGKDQATNYPVKDVSTPRPTGGGGVGVFDSREALEINRARLSHLDSLGIPLSGRSVLDVGCGVGHLSQFFVERNCRVTCVDGRPENIQVLRNRYPELNAHVMDVENDTLSQYGKFDVVFCYGLLYHLENPVAGLRNMASVCKDLLIIETVVTDCVAPATCLVDEPEKTLNQALGSIGNRPSPAFVAFALSRVGFSHIYRPVTPPDHPDFRFDWKNDLSWQRDGHLLRCVLLASRKPLPYPTLALLIGPPAPEEGPDATAIAPRLRVWLDIGSHLGEKTLEAARSDPQLRVYAFEPNIAVASKIMGAAPNFVVLPVAVAEEDGSAEFHLNSFEAASSLLPIDSKGRENWKGGEMLGEKAHFKVPTMRLDTFLNAAGITDIEFLKIDAQGTDLSVVRSAGERIRDIRKITLEVQITPTPLYRGSSTKSEVLDFMRSAGFDLVSTEKQSHDQEENLTFKRTEP